jgi:uncharacterized protein (TIGR02588 family)
VTKNSPDAGDAALPSDAISALEWVVAVLGLAMLVGVTGFLLWRGVQDNGQPPSLRIDVESVEPVHGGYVVELRVTNEGDQTAAAVTVSGALMDGNTLIEEREMTFDYLPPVSSRRGGLFFTDNPADYTLTLHPVGYREP